MKKTMAAVSAFAVVASVISPMGVSAASEFRTYADELAMNNIIGQQYSDADYRLGDNITR